MNPLELSQNLAFDRIAEEFDRVRVPQWFLRADYTIPNAAIPDLTAELILNPGVVVPTLIPPQGSPFNVVPAFLKVKNQVNQGEPTVGGRITGSIEPVQFSLNFVTKPNDDVALVSKFIPPFGVTPQCVPAPIRPRPPPLPSPLPPRSTYNFPNHRRYKSAGGDRSARLCKKDRAARGQGRLEPERTAE